MTEPGSPDPAHHEPGDPDPARTVPPTGPAERPAEQAEPSGDRDPAATPGPFRAATDLMFGQFTALTKMTTSAGQQALSSLGMPMTDSAGDLVGYLQGLIAQVPTPTAQLDRVLEDLQVKRAQVAALQAQLAAFEQQLDLLEQSLKPLREWGRQWTAAQSALAETLGQFRPGKS